MKRLAEKLPKHLQQDRVFVVRTALDVGLQRHAEQAVETSLRQYGREYHASQAAAVVADFDGGVRAMVGGRDYGASQFNRATDALRQPGSSFKGYVYAAALMNGFKPTSIVVDAPICLGNWCPQNYGRSYAGSVTLTTAIQKSINTIPIRLSVSLGNGNPKAGRGKIVELARKMGLRTPLPDTPSLPIGADEVTVLDHTVAYATFPNLGYAVVPHAILEVRSATGEVIWRFDRDGKKPEQVMPRQVALDMNMMLNKAAEEGTGRRAMLDGIRISGKTGTTNAYRDAWFVGFTGNFVAGIWFGNDDYAPTNRMTGGSLPGMTWRQIMTYAHAGIELKPIPGVEGAQPARPVVAAAAASAAQPAEAIRRPAVLSKKGADALVRIERLLEDASRDLVAGTPAAERPKASIQQTGTVAVATQPSVRGN
jgi:penicillin-binding protein 1A